MLVPTIGIEIHAELKSKNKVYSNASNSFDALSNKNISLIDMAMPGMLPQLNHEVVDLALKAALALNCKINKTMHFDRKNYFYPDLPKGYQITQQETPIGYDGYVEIVVDGEKKKIGIERIHIEEDTCKSLHTTSGTKLNFNRAGVPLIEIVSKPDIKSGVEASIYADTVRSILLYLGISDVKIEEGSMRCDTNVSLSEEDSDILGTKVEVKNIGSITNVRKSIDYEVKRQSELLKSGEVITEETRRYDDKEESTILMRKKETGNDYRYFPEPDLPYITLTDEEIHEMKISLPTLPNVLREKYTKLGVSNVNIDALIANYELCTFIEDVINDINPVIAINLITSDILSYLNKERLTFKETKFSKDNFCTLVTMLDSKKISSKQAKEIISIIFETGSEVETIIKENNMQQISDTNALVNIIKTVINDNPNSIDDYKNGHDRAIKYLMGQVMKASRGQANPSVANELLKSELDKI